MVLFLGTFYAISTFFVRSDIFGMEIFGQSMEVSWWSWVGHISGFVRSDIFGMEIFGQSMEVSWWSWVGHISGFVRSDIFGMEIFGQQLVLGGWIIAPVRRSSLLIVIFPPGILAPTVEHDVLSALPSFHLQVKTSDLYGWDYELLTYQIACIFHIPSKLLSEYLNVWGKKYDMRYGLWSIAVCPSVFYAPRCALCALRALYALFFCSVYVRISRILELISGILWMMISFLP